MTDRYEFSVRGEPIPKGSAKAFVNKRSGRAIVTNDNPRTKGWEQLLKSELQAFPDDAWEGPIEVLLTFYVRRPASAAKAIQYPAKRPDLDKLTRAALDAMSNIIFKDDAQVIIIHACKLFGEPGLTAVVAKFTQTHGGAYGGMAKLTPAVDFVAPMLKGLEA